jgi:hypothetical protein
MDLKEVGVRMGGKGNWLRIVYDISGVETWDSATAVILIGSNG